MDPTEQRQKAKRYVKISFLLHLALFLSFSIGSFFVAKPLLLTPSVQIDMVALPKNVKNDEAPPVDTSLPVKENPPPPPPPEEKSEPEPKEEEVALPKAKPEPKPVDDLALKRQKEKEAEKRAKEALKKVRDQLKKEKEEEEEKKQAALEKRKADLKKFEQRYREAIAGNQTNTGSSDTGQLNATINAYAAHITGKIRSNWELPSFLQSQNLSAKIVIYIDSRGHVVKMEFTKVSGNAIFDDKAEAAVRRSNPFFPPPAEMASGLRNSGIEVKFPL
ncbi:MAG TPA: cell envelope integrity protein TolA [Bdellovibrionota bacterium]|jgi:outer membrane biosynthesis protein TonB